MSKNRDTPFMHNSFDAETQSPREFSLRKNVIDIFFLWYLLYGLPKFSRPTGG